MRLQTIKIPVTVLATQETEPLCVNVDEFNHFIAINNSTLAAVESFMDLFSRKSVSPVNWN